MQQNQPVAEYRQNASTNQDILQNASFMMMRIDTSPLLRKIRKDIGGKEIFLMQDKENNFYEEEKQIGLPLANEQGVLHITNLVEEMINPHTVQGNLKGDHYWEFVSRCREEVTNAIVLNCYDWGIDDKYLSYIIDKVMRLVELFLTRPVDNKEREAYAKAFESKEVIQTGKKENAIANFAGGIK